MYKPETSVLIIAGFFALIWWLSKNLFDVKFSKNFKLSEFEVTSTGLNNEAPYEAQKNLKFLAVNILQPWRDIVGRLKVTSGYRSYEVNKKIGGVTNSQHRTGNAADIVPLDMEINKAFRILYDMNLPMVDQAIIENKNGSKWVHVSWSNNPRNQYLAAVWDNAKNKMVFTNYNKSMLI